MRIFMPGKLSSVTMASNGFRILHVIICALLVILIWVPVSAAESVTTLDERIFTATGYWEKNNASRIPFTVDDFQGFRFINLSYETMNPSGGTSPMDCGLVFKMTTGDYFASWKSGSNLVFVFLGEGQRFFNTGFVTFDPRTNPEPSWQEGNYWLLVNMKPENCVNEVRLRIDQVRESGEIPVTMMTRTTTATVTATAPANQAATSPVPSLPASTPSGAISTTAAPPSPAAAPEKTPLQGCLAALAGIIAISIYSIRAGRP
jgi:hypothetical protein